jgi:hypothetical protein
MKFALVNLEGLVFLQPYGTVSHRKLVMSGMTEDRKKKKDANKKHTCNKNQEPTAVTSTTIAAFPAIVRELKNSCGGAHQ